MLYVVLCQQHACTPAVGKQCSQLCCMHMHSSWSEAVQATMLRLSAAAATVLLVPQVSQHWRMCWLLMHLQHLTTC
jgi:hypothetical protein